MTVVRIFLALVALCAVVDRAWGQLFGTERSLGSTIARPTFPDQMPGAGPSDERFLRGSAASRQFIGTALQDLANPVGLQQALGLPTDTRSAIDGLREEPLPRVNRVIVEPPPSRPMPYKARLRVDFEFESRPEARVTAELDRRVRSALARVEPQAEVSVSVRDRTAILEGVVSSPRSRAVAEQLVRLEPGVSRIENRLQVAEALPAPPVLPPPPAALEDSAGETPEP